MQDPVNPGLVHWIVGDVVAAGPLTLAVPVHRDPPPMAGADIVNEPEKLAEVVVPEIVPFQSLPDDDAHVPLTESPACVNCTFTAVAAKLFDSRFPVHVPEICAAAGGVGAVGAVCPPPHDDIKSTHIVKNGPTANR